MELDPEIIARMEEITLAPVNSPEILPTVLPLVLGWFIIELYFGKHENEKLGWNTSVGNAVLWIATGTNLLITGQIDTVLERNAAYLLIISGVFVGYMDFYHKWSPEVAYRISSVDVIYPLAYVTAVIVKTDMPVNETVLKASGLFVIGSIIAFRAVRMMETPARDSFSLPK